jgi:hypothetical protein
MSIVFIAAALKSVAAEFVAMTKSPRSCARCLIQ